MSVHRLARLFAAIGVVGAVALFGNPATSQHSVDFDSYNCSTETPSPDEEPDLTPPPTAAPDDQPPGGDEPTPAPQNCMPMTGERIWGTREIKFSVDTDPARLRHVGLYILSEEEAIPSAEAGKDLIDASFSREQNVRRYETPFQWNSNDVTPYNGKYRIKVVADVYSTLTTEEHSAMNQRMNLQVDNAPKPVPAPKIIAKTTGSVTLQWTAAPEPDVISYTVYRAVTKTNVRPPYTALRQIGLTSGAAYRDGNVSPGFHWYSIKVTRRSVVTPEQGISSRLSQMSAGAEVKSLAQVEKESDGKKVLRKIPDLRRLATPPGTSRLASIPDAPFSYNLAVPDAPPGSQASAAEGSSEEGGADDMRRSVLPVAVGMFLVSSALAVGRMPF